VSVPAQAWFGLAAVPLVAGRFLGETRPLQAKTTTFLEVLRGRVADWRLRARGRQELRGLTAAELHDIGVSRCDAEREALKWFWQP